MHVYPQPCLVYRYASIVIWQVYEGRVPPRSEASHKTSMYIIDHDLVIYRATHQTIFCVACLEDAIDHACISATMFGI